MAADGYITGKEHAQRALGERKCPLEGLGMNPEFWCDRSVFLSGHTGFKGGWIALWLSLLGAKVHGYSLEASKSPNFFTETNLGSNLHSSTIGDIRDLSKLTVAMQSAKPSIVIHMAKSRWFEAHTTHLSIPF